MSPLQVQQKQEELIDQDARLQALHRTRLELLNNRQNTIADKDALAVTLAADLTQVDRNLALLAQESTENLSRKSVFITAPEAGTLSAIAFDQGQTVTLGQTLATLIPSAKHGEAAALEVQLFAPSKTAGFVAPGQTVRIRYAAFPYQKFGLQDGEVTAVSKSPFAPSELPAHIASTVLSNAQQNILGSNTNEAMYRINVKLHTQTINAYGKDEPLKPGMTLEADVVQDERKIWEWIAEPLLARVAKSPSHKLALQQGLEAK